MKQESTNPRIYMFRRDGVFTGTFKSMLQDFFGVGCLSISWQLGLYLPFAIWQNTRFVIVSRIFSVCGYLLV